MSEEIEKLDLKKICRDYLGQTVTRFNTIRPEDFFDYLTAEEKGRIQILITKIWYNLKKLVDEVEYWDQRIHEKKE